MSEHTADHVEQTVLATKTITTKEVFIKPACTMSGMSDLLVEPDRVIQRGLSRRYQA